MKDRFSSFVVTMTQEARSARLAELDMVAELTRLGPDLAAAESQEHRGKKLRVVHKMNDPETATVGGYGRFLKLACRPTHP